MIELPQRKHIRLKGYDYSRNGMYFVTTNSAGNQCVFGTVLVGRGLAPAVCRLSPEGRIAEEQLLLLPQRYPSVIVEKYVIMPNHIHMILQFQEDAAGASPRPTLMQVVGAYKSLTTRECNRRLHTPGRKMWQTSFYESVLQSDTAYLDAWRYIDENPAKWAEDPYYSKR